MVDIYDVNSGTWSIETLSQARSGLAAAATAGKVLFGGGYSTTNSSDVVDCSTATCVLVSSTALSPSPVTTSSTTTTMAGNTSTTTTTVQATQSTTPPTSPPCGSWVPPLPGLSCMNGAWVGQDALASRDTNLTAPLIAHTLNVVTSNVTIFISISGTGVGGPPALTVDSMYPELIFTLDGYHGY